jgi:predicted 3-demethylubiquinone-9 3-methyltransferase (glyoxalase superfamily)
MKEFPGNDDKRSERNRSSLEYINIRRRRESMCGWLKDQYGVSWQIVPKRLIELMNDTDPAKSQKVVQAMLKMQKIIIADLEAAYNS